MLVPLLLPAVLPGPPLASGRMLGLSFVALFASMTIHCLGWRLGDCTSWCPLVQSIYPFSLHLAGGWHSLNPAGVVWSSVMSTLVGLLLPSKEAVHLATTAGCWRSQVRLGSLLSTSFPEWRRVYPGLHSAWGLVFHLMCSQMVIDECPSLMVEWHVYTSLPYGFSLAE